MLPSQTASVSTILMPNASRSLIAERRKLLATANLSNDDFTALLGSPELGRIVRLHVLTEAPPMSYNAYLPGTVDVQVRQP
jgi:hypothetical protein